MAINLMMIVVMMFNLNTYEAAAILEYDKKIKSLSLSDDDKYQYLFNKSLIDEVKIQLLIESNVIVGATWTDYFTGNSRVSSVIPVPDGVYTLLGRSVVQRCYTNETVLSAFKGVSCTCDCKTDVIVKEVERVTVQTVNFNWAWTGIGFTVGVGIGVGLGWLLFN